MADQDLDEFLGVEPQPHWRRYAKWAAIAAVFVLVLLLARCFLGGNETQYATQPAQRGRLVTIVSATGTLEPTNQVTVGSQLSGQITKVLVDVNDRVSAGEPLALIDPSQFDDQVNQARASLAANIAAVGQAQATLEQSNATLARYREVSGLSGGKVPAKTEMDQAIADRDRAVANLSAAKANVLSAKAQLSSAQTQRIRAVIRSPVTGVVLARQVDPGQTVAASFNTPTLFVIAENLSRMKLEVAIDEADVGSVKKGQKATFTVDAFPGRTFPAAITRVDLGSNQSVADASSSSSSSNSTSSSGQVVSYAADLSVANPDLKLRPGMTATADIVTSDKQNVLLIPDAALRFSPEQQRAGQEQSGGIAGAITFRPRRNESERAVTLTRGASQTVYVLGKDGKPKPVEIVTGDTNGSQTEVISGDLKPGMKVITGQLSGAASASAQSRSASGG